MNSLDYSMLKVSYELLNKAYRSSQKDLDREISYFNNIFNKLLPIHPQYLHDIEYILEIMKQIYSKLDHLSNLSNHCVQSQENILSICRYRVKHLDIFLQADSTKTERNHIFEVNNPDYLPEMCYLLEFETIRIVRLLVEHLLRTGFINTAICLSEDNKIIKLVDIDVYSSIRTVEQELIAHNPDPCLTWCQINKSKLRKIHSNLEYNLRVQEFVELIKLKRYSEAISFAEKYLSQVEESFLSNVQCAFGILCFPPDTPLSPYHDLFSDNRWRDLIIQFRSDSYSILQISSQSHLATTLQAGLSALKTHLCCASPHKNNQCPMCTFPFSSLADMLPYAKYTRSRLICSITNTLMNEHNFPMVLPNKRLYGEQGLLQIIELNGTFTCPVTYDVFKLSDCKKVYIL